MIQNCSSNLPPRIGARSASKGLLCAALACAAGFISFACAAAARADDKKVTYDDQLAPIFRQRCSSCHNPTAKKADLDVTAYPSLMRGGSSGAVIEPGEAEASQLFALVTHKSEPFMPQKADKLPDGEIDLIRKWIDGGALENAGSKAAKPKPKMTVAMAEAPGTRPAVVPMPPRMVLEPAFHTSRPPMARSLATSPWAPLVAVAAQRQVLLYNTTTLELVGVFAFPEGQPNIVRFSRDGRLLLAGGGHPAASGKVVVWDITTGERIAEVGNELDAVLAADISADHKLIALGGRLRVMRVYSTATGELVYEKAKHTDWLLALEFSPDGVLLASADRNGGLCVWEAQSGNEYLTLNGHTAAVNAVSWRSDSNLLASASEDATVRLWELENGTQVKNWNAKTSVLSMDFARDGRIVTCGRDQVTRLWDQEGKQLKETLPIGEAAVSVAFGDESSRAITASWAGAVQVYKADDATAVGTLVTNPPALAERLTTAQETLKAKTAAATPLVETVHKAEAELVVAQTALSAGQKEAEKVQAEVTRLASEVKQASDARAASDAERNKAATTIAQLQGAKPLVGEALRNLTEALGKQPEDAKLVEVQRQLTEQLKAMETQSIALQTKVNELTGTIAAADDKLKKTNSQLEPVNKAAGEAQEKVKGLATKVQQVTAALESARKAAQPAEAQLTQAQHDVARWQDEIAFRDQMAALQKELDAARKVTADRQAEVDQATKQLATVQATVNSAKSKLDEASRGVDAVNAKVEAARKPK
jgi:predicted  nucleic acid-binding Zn-ribbon protein/mono/diheme cytochrome c family protein